ncbi:hypothetical protein KDA_63830 [Dictyobacter alpinus]|uniref:Uncharacterized protein n=1 Tax=Dictyobacter alpinus TaxID=2014873 RepID=A0A402BHT9_9CHLR|nr:hypothetical protein [Dictyobacter alpinus]GCE30899.1 hypothetical protein KDA_63830 [Dictyobacter alpinus]
MSYEPPTSSHPNQAAGFISPPDDKKWDRRIILIATLITGALEIVHAFIFANFPQLDFLLPQPYGYMALDILISILIAFIAGQLVARRTRRIKPSLLVTFFALCCYAIASLGVGIEVGLIQVPLDSLNTYMSSFLLDFATELLLLVPLSLAAAWVGAYLGRKGRRRLTISHRA